MKRNSGLCQSKFRGYRKHRNFYSGEVYDISVNEAKGLDRKKLDPIQEGIIVGDYPAYIRRTLRASWKNLLKTEIN